MLVTQYHREVVQLLCGGKQGGQAKGATVSFRSFFPPDGRVDHNCPGSLGGNHFDGDDDDCAAVMSMR